MLRNGVRLKKRAVENQNKNKQSLARILASLAFIFGVGFFTVYFTDPYWFFSVDEDDDNASYVDHHGITFFFFSIYFNYGFVYTLLICCFFSFSVLLFLFLLCLLWLLFNSS